MNTSTPDVPSIWVLTWNVDYEGNNFVGLFLDCEAAKRHVANNMTGYYGTYYQKEIGVWSDFDNTLESHTNSDSRFTLDLVTISDAVPSPMTSFAMAILRGDPAAVDAAQDAITRGA